MCIRNIAQYGFWSKTNRYVTGWRISNTTYSTYATRDVIQTSIGSKSCIFNNYLLQCFLFFIITISVLPHTTHVHSSSRATIIIRMLYSPNNKSLISFAAWMPSSFRLRSIKRLLAAAALSSALCAQPMVRIASTQNVLKVVSIGHNWPNTVSHKKNTRWRIQRHTPNNNED